MSETVVNDIVHGLIKLPDYIQIIIDTEQFQRLRYISQLGMASFVYPTSDYSRFQHSIGTFHLASKLIKQIQNQLKQEGNIIEVTDEEVKCVEIAALCHDLGHGPYSHFWEHALDGIQIAGGEEISTFKHEKLSAKIIEEYIYGNESVKSVMKKNELGEEHVDLIKYMITGDEKSISPGKSGKIDAIKEAKKYFLFEIVANKKSGLDVDKFDYLCRDSIYLGWSNKNKIHDIKRIMHFLRVAKDKDGEWHLAVRDREIFHIHDVFYYRHLLHRYGYQHKTVKAVECMFKQAIKQIVGNTEYRNEFIQSVILIKENKNATKEAKPIDNVLISHEFISKVCDHHLWEIMKKHTSDIVKQIQERKIIKLHCQIQIFRKENNKNRNIENEIKSLIAILKQIPGVADVATSKFSLQSEDKGNPLLAVRFYKKDRNNSNGNDKTTNINELHDILNKISASTNEIIERINNESNENIQITNVIKNIKSLRGQVEKLPDETRNNKLDCFNMEEKDLPDLVKLKTDEFVIMIFKKDRNDNPELDEKMDKLCSIEDIELNNKGIEAVIKRLRNKFEFRKNLY